MKKAFQLAVEAELDREENEEGEARPEDYPHELELGDYTLKLKAPTEAQLMMLYGTSNLGGSASLGAQFRLLRGALEPRSYAILLTLIEAGKIDNKTLVGEEGIVQWLIELASEHPTNAPSDSGASSSSTGKRSTGRSPGKGSTHSE